MKNKTKIILSIISIALILLAWAPWITDEYAINKVTAKLGGPDAKINYLGEEKTIKEIPKNVMWFPFFKGVYLLSEGVLFVTFYGDVM